MKIAGVMTGTSCDGLDIACMEFGADGWRPLWARSASYPGALRKRVLAAQVPGATLSLKAWGEMHRDLGAWMGRTIARILKGFPSACPDAIASHGQTVAHFPSARKAGFTIQLGDPARIAEVTGLTVISNFRDGDMAAGGEGAPLAPRFHQALAGGKTGIAIHNLGGISNLTYLGPKGLTLAFDTGPANLWIDAAAALVSAGRMHFDRDGRLAARGKPDLQAVERILKTPFFHRKPPKSTGRDDFPFHLLLESASSRNEDLVATATAITVESVVQAYDRFIRRKSLPLTAIYFCGGGSRNRHLMECLRGELNGIRVGSLDELGFDSKFLEAQAFAYFGYLALQGKPLGGSWTGAEPGAPSAHIIPGRNWLQVVRRLERANSRSL